MLKGYASGFYTRDLSSLTGWTGLVDGAVLQVNLEDLFPDGVTMDPSYRTVVDNLLSTAQNTPGASKSSLGVVVRPYAGFWAPQKLRDLNGGTIPWITDNGLPTIPAARLGGPAPSDTGTPTTSAQYLPGQPKWWLSSYWDALADLSAKMAARWGSHPAVREFDGGCLYVMSQFNELNHQGSFQENVDAQMNAGWTAAAERQAFLRAWTDAYNAWSVPYGVPIFCAFNQVGAYSGSAGAWKFTTAKATTVGMQPTYDLIDLFLATVPDPYAVVGNKSFDASWLDAAATNTTERMMWDYIKTKRQAGHAVALQTSTYTKMVTNGGYTVKGTIDALNTLGALRVELPVGAQNSANPSTSYVGTPSTYAATTSALVASNAPTPTLPRLTRDASTGRILAGGVPFRSGGVNAFQLIANDYPSNRLMSTAEIDSLLQKAVALNAGFLRAHTLGANAGPNPWNLVTGVGGTGANPTISYNETVWQRMDYAIAKAGQLGVYLMAPMFDQAAVTFSNNFAGSLLTWVRFRQPAATNWELFYSDTQCIYDQRQYLKDFANRINTVNGIAYKDDPTLLWQQGNEMWKADSYRGWISSTAAAMKAAAPLMLVWEGTGADTSSYWRQAGQDQDPVSHVVTSTALGDPNIDGVDIHPYSVATTADVETAFQRAAAAGKAAAVWEYPWTKLTGSCPAPDLEALVRRYPNAVTSAPWSLQNDADLHNNGAALGSDDVSLYVPGKDSTTQAMVQRVTAHGLALKSTGTTPTPPPAPTTPAKHLYRRVGTVWRRRGRPDIGATGGSILSTSQTVYPTLLTHPAAVWTRAGNTLTSPGRRPLPVFDNVDNFVLGQTEPTWENSGCRIPQSQLTVNTTVNLITTADGQVISGLYLPNGRIELRHKNVTITDCIINVGPPGDKPLIHDNCGITSNPAYDTSGARISYVTIDPNYAGYATDPRLNGIYVVASSVYRCAIRNVTDCVAPDVNNTFPSTCNGPSHVWGNYLANRYLSYDPLQTDGTHNDGVQVAGADGNTIIGNSIHNPDATNANGVKGQTVVMTSYHQPAVRYPVVKDNWFYGSYTQVSLWPRYNEGGPATLGATVTGNRHSGTCVWPILCTPASLASGTFSGNVVGSSGLTWNNGTVAPGTAINPTVASNRGGTGL